MGIVVVVNLEEQENFRHVIYLTSSLSIEGAKQMTKKEKAKNSQQKRKKRKETERGLLMSFIINGMTCYESTKIRNKVCPQLVIHWNQILWGAKTGQEGTDE